MYTNYKSNNASKWLRNCLTAVCLSAFLLVGLPTAQAQGGNLPILFFSQREDGLNRNYGMNTDGSNPTLIGNPESRGFFARYSPDGQKIVFCGSVTDANSPVGFRQQIFVMNADGTNQTRLTKHGNADFYPIYSPDGSQIAFSRGGNSGDNIDIYKMNADGSNVIRLTHEPGGDIASDWK